MSLVDFEPLAEVPAPAGKTTFTLAAAQELATDSTRSSGVLTGRPAGCPEGLHLDEGAGPGGLPRPVYASFKAFMADYSSHRWREEGTLLIPTRHGLSVFNVTKKFANGSNNSPMVREGFDQIDEEAATLAGLPVDAIFTSPLERALQSAETLQKRLSAPVVIHQALAEMELGITSARPKDMTSVQIDALFKQFDEPGYQKEFQKRFGLTEAEMLLVFSECRKYRKLLQQYASAAGMSEDEYVKQVQACENTLDCVPPLGESFRQAESSAEEYIASTLNQMSPGNYLLEGHGMRQRIIMLKLLHIPIVSLEQLYAIDQGYGCINVLWRKKGEEKWTLLVFNSDRKGEQGLQDPNNSDWIKCW